MSQSFGRYELVHPLGKGGMSEVFLSRLTGAAGFEKFCIIKTILPQMSADPQFVHRFQHEAKVLVQLNHANIAQIYDMGEEARAFYMAIEYIAGVDLGRLIDKTQARHDRVPVPVALYIAQRALEALGYAHRKVGNDGQALGIVHRDVSPQNVMVSYEGDVKVIDFGLAKSAVSKKGTMPSMVMGKLGYMSPEQARGEPVDYRSDIFSLGVVLWEMLAGRALFQGQTVGEMVAQMSNPKVPSLREFRDDVSEELEGIVRKSLGAKPDERYARADQMARALNEVIVREGHSMGAEEVGTYVRSVCPDEYDSQVKLISSLTMKIGSTPEGFEPIPLQNSVSGSYGPKDTVIRASGPQFAGESMLQGPDEATVLEENPGNPLGWVIAVLATIILAGGGVWYFMRSQKPVDVPRTDVASAPTGPVIPIAAKPEAEPEPVAREEADPQGRVPSVPSVPVFLDRGEFYARVGSAEGFTRGAPVQILGPEDEDHTRAFWGEGTVMEVTDSLVRFQVETAVLAAPVPLFVAPLKSTPLGDEAEGLEPKAKKKRAPRVNEDE
jgi:serine/threonine protein kinase